MRRAVLVAVPLALLAAVGLMTSVACEMNATAPSTDDAIVAEPSDTVGPIVTSTPAPTPAALATHLPASVGPAIASPAVPTTVIPLGNEKAIEVGTLVEVANTGSCLNLRARPGLDQPVIACLPDRALASVRGGPADADRHQWWQIEAWVADQFLRNSPPLEHKGQSSTAPDHRVWLIDAWAEEGFLRHSPAVENLGVWILGLENGELRRLGGSAISQFTWSPDGSKLAFGGNCRPGGLFVAAVNGWTLREVARVPGPVNHIRWLTSGEIEYETFGFGFPTDERGTFRVKPDGSPAVVKVSDNVGKVTLGQRPAPSPDGEWLATIAVANPSDAGRIGPLWVATVRVSIAAIGSGEKRLQAELPVILRDLDGDEVHSLEWSPNSARLAFKLGIANACG